MQRRIIVVAVARDRDGRYLLCKMPADRGVFPGQWGLPGGGIEDGERMEEALRREMREEVGLEIEDIRPLYFTDDVRAKTFPGGRRETLYMIYLLFECRVVEGEVRLNPEFEKHAWVTAGELPGYDLNEATIMTFRRLELLG